MFSSGPNYTKLKTNLRLAINRLKLLEKKKTELAQKARKEIADYLSTGKTERAKIRVEHIIREDYLVEAMEVTEMYCDLLLARYGLVQQMKDLDEGLAEGISSLIWAAPRLQTDVAELKIIADQLSLKYGKPYGQACREQQVDTISERLIHKLSVQAPPKVLVERYLIEIAKNYNVEYEPDPQVMREGEWSDNPLISLEEKNNLGNNDGGATGGGGMGGGGGGMGGMNIPPTGFVGYPQPPMMPNQPFTYPGPVPPSYPPREFGRPTPHPPLSPQCGPSLPNNNNNNNNNNTSTTNLPSVLLTNPQSLTNCFDEFCEVIDKHKPDVVVVSETWFSDTRPATQYIPVGYKVFNDDREGRGGGVAVYAREELMPREVKLKAPPELECVWVDVCNGAMVVCGLYHPPRAPTAPLLMDQIVNSVIDLRCRLSSVAVVIAGDFNNLHQGRLCSSLQMTNLVQEPTHVNSVIDLVLTDRPQGYNKPLLLPPIGRSRHSCVLVTPVMSALVPSGGSDGGSGGDSLQMGGGMLELNLPNVPGQASLPPPGVPFNIPPGGPPPPDPSADPLPDKMSNNMQNFDGSSSVGGGKWDEMMFPPGSSPPPEYSSFLPSGHHSSNNTAPNAPYPSMPPNTFNQHQPPPHPSSSGSVRPQFPPDVNASANAGNLKDGDQPKPAPRSKFEGGVGGGEFALPELPSVPDLPGTATLPDPSNTQEDIDFDDLTKRFEDLKKKK
ncbi:hypothetical protein Pmani_013989 [Petrolisthes manimaculis]|uniref:IST1 homolog n=1 Tax=Petrolisthes manimaculis TaxID=1843537 RepID=A0AAE1UBJ7_9EUCA|nr:hypothetical protein Pmani_013989 [Petrolisthes manimaculis]